jgi:membrane protein DedA with SNARE-associated domain
MTSILGAITNFIIHTISTLGYAGVGLLMAIESACIPLPSEVIAPFAGFLAQSGRFSLFYIAIAGGLGSSVGSVLMYWIGLKGGRPLVEKYGKYILISHHDIAKADRFFVKYGSLSTFIGRLLPVVRTFISLPAGIERVEFKKFLFYSFLGSFIWTYFLAYIGYKLGQNWESLHTKFQKFDVAIVIIIVILILLYIWRHLRHIKRDK